jgi:hypothetical protein
LSISEFKKKIEEMPEAILRSLVVKGETQDQKRIEGGTRRRRRKFCITELWNRIVMRL